MGEDHDLRLTEMAPASVIREMQLISSVLTVARRDWELIAANPLSDVRKPSKPQPRDRLPTLTEVEAMEFSAGADLDQATARASHAFKFAMETARRGGITGLEWDRVDLDRRVVLLTHTKNGRPREVPLSSKAVALLKELPELNPVFGLSRRQLDVLFRKLRDRAEVTGLTFNFNPFGQDGHSTFGTSSAGICGRSRHGAKPQILPKLVG